MTSLSTFFIGEKRVQGRRKYIHNQCPLEYTLLNFDVWQVIRHGNADFFSHSCYAILRLNERLND